ncbi:MAG: patatin-like phospholipase family protein [Planctomycetes bacterium]|nr:patatin-like phospholipase family protein [Planctomycetota bacterium]
MIPPAFQGKTRTAFKALGGRAKATWWHCGVARALQELGFRFAMGRRRAGEPTPSGPGVINPIIGSSGGAIFAAGIAGGWEVESILRTPVTREDMIRPSTFHLRDYLRRVRWRVQMRTGRTLRLRDLGAADLVAPRALYTPLGIRDWMRNYVLGGDDRFEGLAADLYILATELDRPRTVIFGSRASGPIYDYIYVNGVSVADAVAASCALPPYFTPHAIPVEGRVNYYMDGELRDPFNANVAEEAGADLVFVSSVYQSYTFREEAGSAFRGGLWGSLAQMLDTSIDAKMRMTHVTRQRMAAAMAMAGTLARARLPEEEARRFLQELEEVLGHHPRNTIIYIYPENDLALYQVDPFDFSLPTRRFVADRGYRRAREVLEPYLQ